MPRIPKNYDNAVIYKIVCKDISINDCYVGSTTNFTKRKTAHKSFCTNESCKQYSYYVYEFIREHGGWDNWIMVEECKAEGCNDKELLKFEYDTYIRLNATLNKQRPTGKTVSEINTAHYAKHSEKVKDQTKAYYHKNREHQIIKMREYYQKNKEKICEGKRLKNRNLREANVTD